VRDAIAAALARIGAAPAAYAEVTGQGADGMRTIDGAVIDIPAVPLPPPDTPLPAEAVAPIRALVEPFNAEMERQNAEQEALYRARNWNWFRPQPLIDESTAVDRFFEAYER
jgi:hypothetical protein